MDDEDMKKLLVTGWNVEWFMYVRVWEEVDEVVIEWEVKVSLGAQS